MEETLVLGYEQLINLLTTAAIIGKYDCAEASTRGDITDVVERRLRQNLRVIERLA